ncbi:pimeloyl-ACP methyl ester carboxylesterase [Tamaricihabitans halophyticus]|uniref:Pimeloyl-ACP methyl ester carboxylesterase n=1 Tax=Tamaricihabitans halophyticus TaxID=1262583 RepID=A0A4R2Q625_9PSEU|nr:alpha/beta hydrolase [Tamaricihabitans halophyticus]TCP43414.1 pimeloyl-ACP methyl ester carboxylesterase [Tamaricihabitans halophyticus]
MHKVELSAGTIEYTDSGGTGPVLLLLHGFAQNGSVWDPVVRALSPEYRCVVPNLPLGGHRLPLRADADISMAGLARMMLELIAKLELASVTLVQNDWGGAHLVVAQDTEARVSRLVLTSCEAFDNYPPGVPGRAVWLAARIPGGVTAMANAMRIRRLRRLPVAFGWMSKRVPDAVMDGWLRPLLTQPEIRRDARKYLRSVDRRDTFAAVDALAAFTRPALVAWAAEDRVMPPAHGQRLANLLPNGRLVEIADSYALIPQDQPGKLAAEIHNFVRETP